MKKDEYFFEYPDFNNVKEIVYHVVEKYPKNTAFILKDKKGKEVNYIYKTFVDFLEDVNNLGTGLYNLGLKDKRIAVISENRYEWALAYLSIANGTGVVVPLDKSLPENEIISSIERSEVEAIFYSSKYDEIMEKVKKENIGKIKYFISMDSDKTEDKIYSQNELVELGRGLIKNGARSFLDAEIDNNAMAIMIFTSGTTSKSKAVMLSHANIVANIKDITSVFDVRVGDTMLSFLPIHHTFESTVGFLYPMSVGASIAYCEGIRHIADNIREYKISVMISVPLLFESMYKKVMQSVEKKGKTKAIKIGVKISNILRKFGIDKRRQIFKEIHESLGGNLRLFVSGAAAFDPELEKGLNELGIDTYQGYGLTEASPVIASEHKSCTRIGSIGKLFPSLEGKIVDPNEQGIGELAVKGPTVMLGYYQNEEATKETIVDGWLHTGDLAYFDKDDYIFITGRKKNVIVLKNGKNVYPEEIETLINKIEGVKESFVFGKPEIDDDKDLKLSAKIVYDPDEMKEKFGLEDVEEIKKKLWADVKLINKKMPTYKYIKELYITDKELIKTTTQKVKRFEEIKTIK